jgi:hypothetical protein
MPLHAPTLRTAVLWLVLAGTAWLVPQLPAAELSARLPAGEPWAGSSGQPGDHDAG